MEQFVSDWRYYDWHKCPVCGKTWRGNWNPAGSDGLEQSPTFTAVKCESCYEDTESHDE